MPTDPAVRVAAMDDSELEALHKHLDASPVDDPATVEAHHLVASEMLKRGMDHGHEDDDWSVLALVMDEAVVKSGDELGLPDGMEGTLDEVLKDGGKVTVLLTTNGYVLKAEPTVNDVHVDAIMGAYPIRRKKRRKPVDDETDIEETPVEKAEGYEVPAGVREAAKRAMRWIADGQAGDGFTSVGRNRARQLAEGGPVGRDTLVKMRAYFARHGVMRGEHAALEDGEPTPWRVAWDAWGGDAGRAWANRVLGDMEKAYDPILDVDDRGIALYESYESICEEFGPWSPEEAHYMDADDNPFQDQGMHCANCVFYEGGGGCEIVEGPVDAMGLCKLWVIPEDRLAMDEEELLQTMDEDDLAEFGRYASLEDDDAEMEKAGNPEALRDYWRSGGKGKISWGGGGDFTACVAAVSKYMNPEQAKGYCAIRHREVTGMWPGAKANRAHKSVSEVTPAAFPAATFTLPDGSVYQVAWPDDVTKYSRSEAGRRAALARWQGGGPTDVASVSLTTGGAASAALPSRVKDAIKSNLSKGQIAEAYGPSYETGREHRKADPDGARQEAADRIVRRDAAAADLMGIRGRTIESESLSATVADHQGYIDGALGRDASMPTSTGFGYRLAEFISAGMSGADKSAGSLEKGDRSAAGRKAALARWGNRGPDAEGGEDERAAAPAGGGGGPSARDAAMARWGGGGDDPPRRPGMGDSVPISDEDFEMLKAGSAGPHIIGRTKDGAPIFTPERQALHDKIVSEHVDGVPVSSDPTYHLMGGGPAAGKSNAIKSGIVDVPPKDQAVQINADDIKYRVDDDGNPVGTSLVQADGISNSSNWAAHTHEESSYLAKRVQAAAVERGQDMVLDGTGDNKASSVQGKIAGARAAGYKVKGHYVTCPTEVAVERARIRGEETGRVVPESVVRGTHAGVSRVVPEVASSFDTFELVDTSGPTPRRVASATRDSEINIEDQGLWDGFVAKGSE